MDIVSNEVFQKRLKEKYGTPRIVGKENYKNSRSAPRKLKHNGFDGGDYDRVYMSSRYKFS